MSTPVAAELEAHEVNYASISTTTTGLQTIVTGVADKQIVVLSYVLRNTSAQNLTWDSASTALSGVMAAGASTTIAVDGGGVPVMATEKGESLRLNLGGSTQVSGHVSYVLV